LYEVIADAELESQPDPHEVCELLRLEELVAERWIDSDNELLNVELVGEFVALKSHIGVTELESEVDPHEECDRLRLTELVSELCTEKENETLIDASKDPLLVEDTVVVFDAQSVEVVDKVRVLQGVAESDKVEVRRDGAELGDPL
jgi:hypothetical protein